jgi:hypothetical protein
LDGIIILTGAEVGYENRIVYTMILDPSGGDAREELCFRKAVDRPYEDPSIKCHSRSRKKGRFTAVGAIHNSIPLLQTPLHFQFAPTHITAYRGDYHTDKGKSEKGNE